MATNKKPNFDTILEDAVNYIASNRTSSSQGKWQVLGGDAMLTSSNSTTWQNMPNVVQPVQTSNTGTSGPILPRKKRFTKIYETSAEDPIYIRMTTSGETVRIICNFDYVIEDQVEVLKECLKEAPLESLRGTSIRNVLFNAPSAEYLYKQEKDVVNCITNLLPSLCDTVTIGYYVEE